VFWALGGWRWIVAPATFFFAYAVLTPLPGPEQRGHDIRGVMSYSAAGLWWIFVAYTTHHQELLFAFTASFAAQLAMYSFYRIRKRDPEVLAVGELAINLFKDWAIMLLPWLLIAGVSRNSVGLALIALVTTAAAAIALYALQNMTHDRLSTEVRRIVHASIGFAASFVCSVAVGMVKP
jgi:hypothetical protein